MKAAANNADGTDFTLMKIIRDTLEQAGVRGAVVSIGNFDGLHLGHRRLLDTARRLADERGVPLVVVTFDPHPAMILHPERAPGVLTPTACKEKLLEALGVDRLILITDSLRLLNLSPKDFIDEFLMKHLAPCALVEGPNFTFGYGRSGTTQTLRELGAQRGFEVHEVGFLKVTLPGEGEEKVCSSTAIRRLLQGGQVENAARMLGRNYRLIGRTVPGRGIGRSLGFPTANIQPDRQIIPDEGVYAGYAVVADRPEDLCTGGSLRPAAFSIGRAKTFITEHPLLLEAHLLDGPVGSLYGKCLAMDFVRRIRSQQRFESPEALKRQIEKDCCEIRSILFGQ